MSDNSGETAPKVIGRPFVKGQSGNPLGRPPKDWTWKSLVLEAAEEIANGSDEPKKKLMARKLVDLCVDGNIAALKEAGDRIDGKVPQGLEHSGPDGGEIPVLVRVAYE